MQVSAKFRPPLVGRVRSPSRLINQLNSPNARRVCWVCAEAGAGKTTLAATWVSASSRPYLWYQLDALDADLGTFFQHMGLCARVPASRLPKIGQEYQGIPGVLGRRFFEKLVQLLGESVVVVFDNYQDVPKDSPIHEALREAVTMIPPGWRFLVLSREAPPPPWARRVAEEEVEFIASQNLRLTTEEITALVSIRRPELSPERSKEQVHRLGELTRGWAAGIILLLEGSNWSGKEFDVDGPSIQPVIDYLHSEVLASLDERSRQVLLKTAFLESVPVASAERISQEKEAHRILEALRRRNLFVERIAGDEEVYRYHPLLRTALLILAQEKFGSHGMHKLRLETAAILEEEGATEAAALHLAAIGEWNALVQLIHKKAKALLQEGKYRTLQSLLTDLPEGILQKDPWLLHYYGMTHLGTSPKEASKSLEAAYERFSKDQDLVGMCFSYAGLLHSRFLGEAWTRPRWLDAMVAHLEELEARCRELQLPEEVSLQLSSSTLATLSCMKPVRFFHRWLKEAEAWLPKFPDPTPLLMPTMYLATLAGVLNLAKEGEIARGLLGRILARLSEEVRSSPWFCAQQILMDANLAFVCGREEDIARSLEAAVSLSKRYGIHLTRNLVVLLGIYLALGNEDLERAKNYLVDLVPSAIDDHLLSRASFAYSSGLVSLRSGDLRAAEAFAAQAASHTDELGDPLMQLCIHVFQADVAVSQGHFAKAETLFTLAEERNHIVCSPALGMEVMWLRADMALQIGNQEQIRETLYKTMEALANCDPDIHQPHWHPPRLRRIFSAALREQIQAELAQFWIVHRGLRSEPDKGIALVAEAQWAWQLKLLVLGTFLVQPDLSLGPIPRRLLWLLICQGKEGIAVQEVMDTLWPSSDGDRARRSLDTTVYRLRRFLAGFSQPDCITLEGGQLALRRGLFYVDLWELYDTLAEMEGQIRQQNWVESALLERTLRLYRGPLLPGEPLRRIVSARMRLHRRLLQIVGRLLDPDGPKGPGPQDPLPRRLRQHLETMSV